MVKKIILWTLGGLFVLVVCLVIFFGEELVRLNKVLTLFEPQNISENFRSFPSFVPTSVVAKSPVPSPIVSGPRMTLPASFQWEDSVIQTQEFLDHTNTDGLLVYQEDSLRFLYYANGFEKQDIHISWSMSKSLISGLIGIALEEGLILSINQLATDFVPELSGSGYENVTIENLLQMSSGVRFNEDYGDFN
ncbi:MAG: serine hydrolase, partial [Bacteroidota bacterium]